MNTKPDPTRPATGARIVAVALAALLYASPSLAEWVVSKDPMGPGYLVSKTGTNIAPIKTSNAESAKATADVLNKFDSRQDRKNK